MDRKDDYHRIETLEGQQDCLRIHGCEIVDYDDDTYVNGPSRSSPSSVSSSPPKDFCINMESSQESSFNKYNALAQDSNQLSTSLASSMSIDSDNDSTPTSVPVNKAGAGRVIRCPVCEKPMRTFYCAKCIQRGQYVTLESTIDDKFAENSLKLHEIEFPPDIIDNVNEQALIEGRLRVKLRSLSRKTEALKSLLEDQKTKLDQTRRLLVETKSQLETEKKANKSKEGKIELIKRYIISRKASVNKRRDMESCLIDEMKQHVNRRVYQLTTDVFPIEEFNLLEQNNSFVNMETSPLLTFSNGSHHQIEQQTAFSIVEPWLPNDGDYSAYSLWMNDNQDHVHASMNDLSERNPAFRIGAGLAYTTQLVKNLASYLDVILPAKIELETFNRELLTDPQFSYNVAKLNANVIHLCVSQGVDISLLHSQRTLKNLILLFNLNVSDLGRRPIMELDNEDAAKKIEEQLSADLSLVQERFYDFSKFSDDDDAFDSEWEISDTINPSEMQLATEQSIQQNSYISRLPLRLLSSFWGTAG